MTCLQNQLQIPEIKLINLVNMINLLIHFIHPFIHSINYPFNRFANFSFFAAFNTRGNINFNFLYSSNPCCSKKRGVTTSSLQLILEFLHWKIINAWYYL